MNNKTYKSITVIIMFSIMVGLPVVVYSTEKTTVTPTHTKIKQMIFVKKSKACACTTKRIQDGEIALKKALKSVEYEIPCKSLDTQTDIVETAKLKKKTKWNFLPVLIFIDHEDNVITKLQGFITEKNILEVIKQNETGSAGSGPKKE